MDRRRRRRLRPHRLAVTRTPTRWPVPLDDGECQRCQGSGWIICNQLGRYLGAGPLPEFSAYRGLHDAECDACNGSGRIALPE